MELAFSAIYIRDMRTYLVQFATLARLLWIKFVQAVQPCQLEQLLREEEAGDEEWLGTEEGQILVVDVFHVRFRQHAVLLRCEVDEEGGRCLSVRLALNDVG